MVALAAFTISLEVWSPFEKTESAAYVSTNITYHNTLVEQLPEYIQVRYNNLGFIGEDFRDSITRPRVFFVGWSNTQSLYVTLLWCSWSADFGMAPTGPSWYGDYCTPVHSCHCY